MDDLKALVQESLVLNKKIKEEEDKIAPLKEQLDALKKVILREMDEAEKGELLLDD